MIRKAVVGGQFYEKDFGKLDSQITDSFLSERGPGELPVSKRKGPSVLGAIAPHAGYMFSGPCAAWCYKEIGEREFPSAFIILGVDHSGYGKTSLSKQDFETPFGLVRADQELASQVIEKCGIAEDNEPHAFEHSIEVQLPFLQFVNKQYLNDIHVLPIIISQDIDVKELGLGLKEAIMDYNRPVTIIASSDFTHYGRNYGYVPFTSEVQERLYKLDEGAIALIRKMDSKAFLDYVYETGATICGAAGIAVLMNAIKASKARLLQYYTSGDITGDYRNAVGYASILFD